MEESCSFDATTPCTRVQCLLNAISAHRALGLQIDENQEELAGTRRKPKGFEVDKEVAGLEGRSEVLNARFALVNRIRACAFRRMKIK